AIARYGRLADQGRQYNAGFAMSLLHIIDYTRQAWDYLGPLGHLAGGVLAGGIMAAAFSVGKLNDHISLGLPMWKNTSNLWFGLGGKLQMFGGALTAAKIPAFLGSAFSGIHMLVEGIIEVAATLIPAVIALGAFASAAVDATN